MRSITRAQCIDELRTALLARTDDEHSMCEVATREGIYCHGFAQWTFEELKRRYDWIANSRPGITRPELERLANLWQLARQKVFGTQLSCDTQTREHDTCLGFDEWDDATLERYHAELCDESVRITRP
jgi:hypothetical protein